jgi:peptidoglycan/xylan/chitin deacetylase (PgdA/CDA1 family)
MGELGAFLLWATGLSWLVRATLARRGVGILLYHDPEPALFEEHLAYLSRHYQIVPFADVAAALEAGDGSRLPSPAVVLHLDDGYRRNVELAEILERRGVRATLYLCSHLAGTSRRFWSKLAGGRSKQLRLMPHAELLEKLESEVGFRPEREYVERQALSREELRRLAPVVELASHGSYHFSAATFEDAALDEDLRNSRERVAALGGQPCEHYSFPFGDHGEREQEAARRCGYLTARTTEPGWVRVGCNPYALPILADVPGDASVNVLRAHLTGLPRLLKRAAYRLVTRHLHGWRTRYYATRPFFVEADRKEHGWGA